MNFLKEVIPWGGRSYLWAFYGKAVTLEVFAEGVEKLNLLKEEVEFWIFYRNWFPEQQDVKVKMGVGATSEFATVKRLLWTFCGGSGKTEFFKEEVVFWIFWRKWFPEQQSIKLKMGVGATSELSTVKQLPLSFCGGSGKTEFIEGGSGVLNFLQELIPWAARCESKDGSRGYLRVFKGKAFTLSFLRRKCQNWMF